MEHRELPLAQTLLVLHVVYNSNGVVTSKTILDNIQVIKNILSLLVFINQQSNITFKRLGALKATVVRLT